MTTTCVRYGTRTRPDTTSTRKAPRVSCGARRRVRACHPSEFYQRWASLGRAAAVALAAQPHHPEERAARSRSKMLLPRCRLSHGNLQPRLGVLQTRRPTIPQAPHLGAHRTVLAPLLLGIPRRHRHGTPPVLRLGVPHRLVVHRLGVLERPLRGVLQHRHGVQPGHRLGVLQPPLGALQLHRPRVPEKIRLETLQTQIFSMLLPRRLGVLCRPHRLGVWRRHRRGVLRQHSPPQRRLRVRE